MIDFSTLFLIFFVSHLCFSIISLFNNILYSDIVIFIILSLNFIILKFFITLIF